jgi:hypothetical protein
MPGIGGIAADDEELPRALGRCMIGAPVAFRRDDLDDVAIVVGAAGIGSIDLICPPALVDVITTYTRPVSGLASTSSGLSRGVASRRSAARRASSTTSPWLVNPLALVTRSDMGSLVEAARHFGEGQARARLAARSAQASAASQQAEEAGSARPFSTVRRLIRAATTSPIDGSVAGFTTMSSASLMS